jgi:hypothetical protein
MVDGRPQVWFTDRSTRKVIKREPGQTFDVGTLTLVIVDVFGSDLIVQAEDGERWLLTLGDRITDALALPPEH